MSNILRLSDLDVGQRAKAYSLTADGAIRRRLQDIGLIEGTVVECVLKSPCQDPAAYLIRGGVIAIRGEDAEKILVSV